MQLNSQSSPGLDPGRQGHGLVVAQAFGRVQAGEDAEIRQQFQMRVDGLAEAAMPECDGCSDGCRVKLEAQGPHHLDEGSQLGVSLT